MKTKHILTLLIALFFAHAGWSQGTVAQRQRANEAVIPKAVMKVFKEQYPDVMIKGWYVTHITYWQNDYSSGWYNDWYGQRNVVVYSYSKPSYYEVEFVADAGELSRAIYNLNGYWYETRSQLRGLPLPIIEALQASKYANWKISPMKERIEAPGWPVDVYRFKVSKGLQARILRMDDQGNFIQEKFLGE